MMRVDKLYDTRMLGRRVTNKIKNRFMLRIVGVVGVSNTVTEKSIEIVCIYKMKTTGVCM